MSTFLDLAFGSDQAKRKAALEVADDIARTVARAVIQEAGAEAVHITGSVSIDLTVSLKKPASEGA